LMVAMSVTPKSRSLHSVEDRVRTKRVAEPAAPDDGTRVLVMRLWPRGVRKTAADQWLKGLGTPLNLIREWKTGTIAKDGCGLPTVSMTVTDLAKLFANLVTERHELAQAKLAFYELLLSVGQVLSALGFTLLAVGVVRLLRAPRAPRIDFRTPGV